MPTIAPVPAHRTTGIRFGSAAALGSTQLYHGRSPLPSRGRTSSVPPGIAEKHAITSGVSVDDRAGGVRARDFAAGRDTEAGPAAAEARIHEEDAEEMPKINLGVALGALIGATALTYVTAEALTDALEAIGRTGAVSPEWLGLILLAVVGNAAEHVTAVFVAYRNKVDLALAVSVGSCIQIALFVIPLLVLLGWAMGKPMSLLFDPLETLTLFLSVLLVRFATEDGRTHYMSGVVLLGTCEYLPMTSVHGVCADGTCRRADSVLILVLSGRWGAA
jgi:Ca2+:H+ antiporter